MGHSTCEPSPGKGGEGRRREGREGKDRGGKGWVNTNTI